MKTLIRITICAAVALAFQVNAEVPPIELKGVPLGATQAELTEKIHGFSCSSTRCFYLQSSASSPEAYRFGSVTPVGYAVELVDDRVAYISVLIQESAYGEALAALKEKYGRPTTERVEKKSNAMGATFESRIATWSRKDGQIKIEQRGSTVDRGSVTMHVPDFFIRKGREAEEKARAAAKNL